jgi:hypothetical protein
VEAAGLPDYGEVPGGVGILLIALGYADAGAEQDVAGPILVRDGGEALDPLQAGVVGGVVEDIGGLQAVEGLLCANEEGP